MSRTEIHLEWNDKGQAPSEVHEQNFTFLYGPVPSIPLPLVPFRWLACYLEGEGEQANGRCCGEKGAEVAHGEEGGAEGLPRGRGRRGTSRKERGKN